MVEEIAVGTRTGHFNMLEAYKRQHYHEILHYRCFRVETPRHRVLEDTLNMGIYFIRIKLYNLKKDTYANKCDMSQGMKSESHVWKIIMQASSISQTRHTKRIPLILCCLEKLGFRSFPS
jgi:hypothetical protein